jgi:hypothetical protein
MTTQERDDHYMGDKTTPQPSRCVCEQPKNHAARLVRNIPQNNLGKKEHVQVMVENKLHFTHGGCARMEGFTNEVRLGATGTVCSGLTMGCCNHRT